MTSTPRAKRDAVILCVLLAVVFSLHQSLFRAPRVSAPDLLYLFANPDAWRLENIPGMFAGRSHGSEGSFYHPLPLALYAAYHRVFGADPTWFRSFQLLLVWATAGALFVVERAVLGPWAWAAAFLYAVHPLHSSLTLLGVRDQLVVLIFLAGLGLYRRRSYASVAALYLTALLCKETALVFPALLLADDLASGRRMTPDESRRRTLFFAALAAIAAGQVLLHARIVGSSSRFWGYAEGASLRGGLSRLEYILTQMTGLSFPGAAWRAAAAAALLGFFGWSASGLPRRALFYAAWIFVILVPASGLLPVYWLSVLIFKTGTETHRLFLPLVGYSCLLALVLKESWETRSRARLLVAAALSCLLAVSTAGLLARSFRPLDPRDLDTGAVLPALAWLDSRRPKLAAGYRAALAARFREKAPALESFFDGALDDPCRAVHVIRAAAAVDDDVLWKRVQAGLSFQNGCRLSASGRLSQAVRSYEEASLLDPGHADAYLQAALARWELGDRTDALASSLLHRAAIRRLPHLQRSRCDCGLSAPGLVETVEEARSLKDAGIDAYLRGDPAAALALLRRSVRLDRSAPESLLSLGALLLESGDRQGALSAYDEALAGARKVSRLDALLDEEGSSFAPQPSQEGAILSARATAAARRE